MQNEDYISIGQALYHLLEDGYPHKEVCMMLDGMLANATYDDLREVSHSRKVLAISDTDLQSMHKVLNTVIAGTN